jgi:HD-GYP domain-containing protein (c-di-GMP phosphodiesterase class II)
MKNGNRWDQLYRELRGKYVKLVEHANTAVRALNRNRIAFRRLLNSYYRLKRNYLIMRKYSTKKVMALIDHINNEKYQVVFDEYRRLLKVSDAFLSEVEMDRAEFAKSIYVDILFERYLPAPDRVHALIDIPSFRFPVLIKNFETDSGSIHPFAHFIIAGKIAQEHPNQRYVYFLNIENITDSIELDYFQKTDSLINSLAISNHKLLYAKKTIEMHKRMLISLTCSLVGEYSRETSAHLRNMEALSRHLAQECRRLGLIQTENYDLDEYVKDLSYTSVLHDIGKMAIPSEILEKDESLSPDEQSFVQKHPAIGASYLKRIIDMFQADSQFSSYCGFLMIPYEICLHHHERWDGSGYPDGLRGESIPIAARIIAVADTYEALRGNRIYNHNPKSHGECREIIQREAGRQFDPRVVEAFLNIDYLFATVYDGGA